MWKIASSHFCCILNTCWSPFPTVFPGSCLLQFHVLIAEPHCLMKNSAAFCCSPPPCPTTTSLFLLGPELASPRDQSWSWRSSVHGNSRDVPHSSVNAEIALAESHSSNFQGRAGEEWFRAVLAFLVGFFLLCWSCCYKHSRQQGTGKQGCNRGLMGGLKLLNMLDHTALPRTTSSHFCVIINPDFSSLRSFLNEHVGLGAAL